MGLPLTSQSDPFVRSAAPRRGRLVIFLGYAAGVGKTTAALRAARRLADAGDDVVIAHVEDQDRAGTATLLAGLERVTGRVVNRRGRPVAVLDVDATLRRGPAFAVVDELAQAVPDGRGARRCDEVAELLDAGIGVLTTLNVHQLASERDEIERRTGIAVRNVVDDDFVLGAAELIAVAPPVDELLARLSDRKVPPREASRRAARGFYRPEVLAALRDRVLLRVAAVPRTPSAPSAP